MEILFVLLALLNGLMIVLNIIMWQKFHYWRNLLVIPLSIGAIILCLYIIL